MLEQLLSGVLATAALKLFMSFLPTILYSIIESTFHLKSGLLLVGVMLCAAS